LKTEFALKFIEPWVEAAPPDPPPRTPMAIGSLVAVRFPTFAFGTTATKRLQSYRAFFGGTLQLIIREQNAM